MRVEHGLERKRAHRASGENESRCFGRLLVELCRVCRLGFRGYPHVNDIHPTSENRLAFKSDATLS